MQLEHVERLSDYAWRIPPHDGMRVPAIIFASRSLMEAMDDKVAEQIDNVAKLPGIVGAAYAMPDAHWGYGFPIGGVAAFDAEQGGVISAGGVGFDISCGVRTLRTGLKAADVRAEQEALADVMEYSIPAGVGSRSSLHLTDRELDEMLLGGAQWAVQSDFGRAEDLEYIEEQGCMPGAEPWHVSERAKNRQRDELGTLGSGNHYAEVQRVVEIYDERIAKAFGLAVDDVEVCIHCGSRGLGHQIGTEFLRAMALKAKDFGIDLPDRELACVPIRSELGQRYLGAMRAGINCSFANRQVITHFVREAFRKVLPQADLTMLYDVSHNTCKVEHHPIDGVERELYVHRKGATRAFGPGHPSLPAEYKEVGQPVLIGGTMGTSSYILAGTAEGMRLALGSACHGAGRAMSRHQATHAWRGKEVAEELANKGILIRSPSWRGVAEEAPGAYKDVDTVAEASELAGLARRVARLEPMICVKG